MLEPLIRVTSPILALPDENIDTDRIVPARFLTTTSSEGLGTHAFTDWKRDPACPLNDPRAAGATILVGGHNFGCGSSREHAAWALKDLGVRVVISSQIADIFRNNATRNGILPIVAPRDVTLSLLAQPFAELTVDLEACRVSGPALESSGHEPFTFEIPPFARTCLLQGVDQLGYLLSKMPEIDAFDEAAGR